MASISFDQSLDVSNAAVAAPESVARAIEELSSVIGGGFLGVESRPGVCGGEPVIVRTRIPIWVLEKARRSGLSEEQILGMFPSLGPQDLALAWAYVASHRGEIDEQIRHHDEAA
jgi:uncharacterized protein (DUF433 family)